jgi:acyl-CoA synthetase (AMP-forming)/AMP-acid ligase II/thioesterase domain-containing protein/acyl carrier protein
MVIASSGLGTRDVRTFAKYRAHALRQHARDQDRGMPDGATTIAALLDAGRASDVAMVAPGRPPLTYSALRAHVRHTVGALNGLGIGRNDAVALVLPNGPELACAFLGVAAAASAAPLNPECRKEDFRFYLSDLGARALLLASGADSPALAVAAELGVPVLRIEHDSARPAGRFTLSGKPAGPPRNDGFAAADDVALILHTSGTTARPKMVPLTQSNLAASAHHIGGTLHLSRADRCLNVMPLFHIHGLVAGVLSSLAAGGSVFCAPRLDALQFFRWLSEARPTWYTAVPTMHQAVLAQVERHRAIVDEARLRFIRSSSAALPVSVLRHLEHAFGAPVIESYGMTEAAHQMTSNPLPPAARKPGTVGRAAGPDVALMGPDGSLLSPGTLGEVVIRGPNVTAGYRDPEANAQAFCGGWFRTGDQGVMDPDGYLTITGRLKDIINRGGEKVSPKEIDDALLEHAGVAAAAAFPLPHPTLGQEIAAVVVPAKDAGLSEAALTQYLAGRLPRFKIPRRLVFADDIPKGPTGKIQRYELAAALRLSGAVADTRAAAAAVGRSPTPLEAALQAIWAETLGIPSVGLHDDFFLLGGDSLQAVQLVLGVQAMLGHSLGPASLIECGTVAAMAALIEAGAPATCIVPLRASGARPPFFCVHGISGQVLHLRSLAHYLCEAQPFYAIQSVGLDGKRTPLSRIEDMAAHYIAEMRRYQPRGPYYIGGYSMGGWVAFEMTRQLHAAGERVALLALIDAYFTHGRRLVTIPEWLGSRWREFRGVPPAEKAAFLAQRASGLLIATISGAAERRRRGQASRVAASAAAATGVEPANRRALAAYRLGPLDCDAVLFSTRLVGRTHPVMYDGWRTLIKGKLERRTLPGGHRQLFDEPFVRALASELDDCLQRRQPCQSAMSTRSPDHVNWRAPCPAPVNGS